MAGENRLEDGTSAGWWDCGYVAVQRVVEAFEAYGLSMTKQLVDEYELVRQHEKRRKVREDDADAEIEGQSTIFHASRTCKEMVEARLEFYKAYRKSLTQERKFALPRIPVRCVCGKK